MLFYNGGATLTTEGSDSLEDLKSLEAQGVQILTCGTCLDYYGLKEMREGELDFLKKYMDRVETLSLDESKVERLESVTARILSEFDADGPLSASRKQVLQ